MHPSDTVGNTCLFCQKSHCFSSIRCFSLRRSSHCHLRNATVPCRRFSHWYGGCTVYVWKENPSRLSAQREDLKLKNGGYDWPEAISRRVSQMETCSLGNRFMENLDLRETHTYIRFNMSAPKNINSEGLTAFLSLSLNVCKVYYFFRMPGF